MGGNTRQPIWFGNCVRRNRSAGQAVVDSDHVPRKVMNTAFAFVNALNLEP